MTIDNCAQVEMVKEGLEGALMEAIGTETVVWKWHYYPFDLNFHLMLIFICKKVEVHSLEGGLSDHC